MVDDGTARVVVLGEGVDENEALFVGSLGEARAFVHALSPAAQREVAIVTDGRVLDPREI